MTSHAYLQRTANGSNWIGHLHRRQMWLAIRRGDAEQAAHHARLMWHELLREQRIKDALRRQA